MHTQQERVFLFIDGISVYVISRALGIDIDYKLLLEHFRRDHYVVRATYYTTLTEEQETTSMRPLIDWLDYNGFRILTKPLREFTDNQGRRKVKGSIDIELCVDFLEAADQADHLILFSGDGNFRRMVEAVQNKGKRVTVVSSLTTQPPIISDELRRQADHFVGMADLLKQISPAAVVLKTDEDMRPAKKEMEPEMAE